MYVSNSYLGWDPVFSSSASVWVGSSRASLSSSLVFLFSAVFISCDHQIMWTCDQRLHCGKREGSWVEGGIASCVTLTYLCEIFWNRVCSAACAWSSPFLFFFYSDRGQEGPVFRLAQCRPPFNPPWTDRHADSFSFSFRGLNFSISIVFLGHNNVTLFLRLQITNYSEFLFSGLHNLANGLGYGN